MTLFDWSLIVLVGTSTMVIEIDSQRIWNNLIGSWSDSGLSWTGSVPTDEAQFHYGPVRLWTTPLNSDKYEITSRVQVLNNKACGHVFKYKQGSVRTRNLVTKAWGYFLWDGKMYITSSGQESSPSINFGVTSNSWYKLKSVVNGINVKVYVNGNLAKEITMSGSEADSKSNNYVGIWCHARIPIKGDSFHVAVSAPGCMKLNLSRPVKTSPGDCMTSHMKANTNCSFSCLQGYQLQGPPFTLCGSNGEWTNSAKAVSCKDVNECAVSNGGCSHKCVNTAGGYKCECPDPELSLSSDNKTCHAPGVDVECNSNNMTIVIPKSLLRGLDREHLRLLDTTCRARETNTHFFLTTPLNGCNTTRRFTPTAIVYSNAVLEIPVAAKGVITRVREIEIPFSCYLSKYGVVSSVASWKPSNRKLVFSDEGKGNFTLSLNMFPDNRFVSPYMKDDFPIGVVLRERLFFEVLVTSDDKQLSIIADRCFATPTQDQSNPLKYGFIKKGCPNDVTVQYHSAPSVSAQRFSLEAFKFIAGHPFVFVHCHVTVCNATDPDSQCVQKCPSSGRGKRAAGGQMTDTYFLAEGPLHLAHNKREEKRANNFRTNGSGSSLLMTLLVICAASLMGTALMIFKKSRDKPAGYTLLAYGDQQHN
ncbi:ZP domain-containing protein [Pocillopora verrucosa]|uniref:ZP domain-containing protein n=1 Tax=Pocillopora verrucosa TaxID=203993 RepID=UPI00333F2DF4